MNPRSVRLACLLSLAVALQSATAVSPGILSFIDVSVGRLDPRDPLAPGPKVEVIDLNRLRAAQLNPSCVDSRASSGACRYEYRVGYLMDPTNPLKDSVRYSEEIAGEMRRLWQEFEDRSYFHLQVSLNNSYVSSLAPPSEGYVTACDPLGVVNDTVNDAVLSVLGVSALDQARALPFQLQYEESHILPGLRPPGALMYQPHQDRLSLFVEQSDWWAYGIPREHRARRCANVPTRLLPDFGYPLDGSAAYSPSWKQCLFGLCIQSPNFPGLEGINQPEVNRRAMEACARMVGMQQEYAAETLKTALTKMPFALHWDGPSSWHALENRSGALLQPIASTTPKPQALPELLLKAGDLKLKDYFAWTQLPPQTAIDALKKVPKLGYPGVKQLEEAKRLIEPVSVLEQERFGMTPFFQLQYHGDAVLSKRGARLYTLSTICEWAAAVPCVAFPSTPIMPIGINVSPAGCTPNPVPGTVTYLGPRMHAKWVNVPEGYHLPNVLGEVRLR